MGFYGRSDVVDESLHGLSPPGSDCLLPVDGDFGEYLDNSGIGLFDKSRGFEVCENAVLEQNSRPEMASELVDCNGDDTDHPCIDKESSSEAACLLSDSTDQPSYVFQSQNSAIMDVGIVQVLTAVGTDQPEDGHGNIVFSVSEQLPNIEFGVGGLCLDESNKDNQIGCLGSIKESYLAKKGTECEHAMGNLAQTGEIHLVSSSLTASPSKCTQLKEQNDAKNVIGLSEETCTNFLMAPDEKHDVLARALTGLKAQTTDIEENSCNLIGGTSNIVSDGSIEIASSLQMSKLSGVVDMSSSRHLTSDDQEIDDFGGNPIRSGVVDYPGFPDIERKETAKFDLVSISTCSDAICSSSRRRTRQNKSNQMAYTRKTARQHRKIANKKFCPDGTIGISLKIAKGKRSCPCRQARSSVWGEMGNIVGVFVENDGVLKPDTQLVEAENCISQKRKSGNRGKRRQKIQAGGSRLTSGGKFCASTSCIRLKVKMEGEGGQRRMKVVLLDVKDSPASAPTVVSERALDPDCRIDADISKFANSTLHKSEEHVLDTQFTNFDRDMTKLVTNYVLDSRHGDKELESSVTQEASIGNTSGGFPGVSSQVGSEALEEAVINRYSDPGTSPDSEVINVIQDVGIDARVQEDFHDAVLTTSHSVVDPLDASATSFNLKLTSSKKGKKKGKTKGNTYPSAECFAAEEKLSGEGSRNKSRKSAKHRPRQKSFPDSETLKPGETLKMETFTKINDLSSQDVAINLSESLNTQGLLETDKSVGLLLPKGSKSNVAVSKRRSRVPNSTRHRRGNAHEQQKKGIQKSANKSKAKEKSCLGQVIDNGESLLETVGGFNISPGMTKRSESREREINVEGHCIIDELGQSDTGNTFASEDLIKSSITSIGLDRLSLPPRNAWVRCDDCYKWRCISAGLADSIEETNCRWTCEENMDKAFADCSIPQEKTNAEINEELEISDASCEEDASDAYPNSKGFECKQLAVSQRASWTLIKSNLFLHRSRKTQTIDEIMVCHCKPPPLDGSLSCGEECLNRMLNIECVRGTCPCGDLCSNQQFQNRKYAKLKWFRCGKKGYGLQVLENVSRGKFLIEYVGEVLDLHAYEARQREYASRGQKHFYFMTLNGNEVIDACAKGNLGRFINHSCDPNCRTEKWMVNGEVCIGLFAVRDIKKGEEVTFDYNYVRVFGAAAKKCVCGSSECRGYIGGDPLNTETVVQGDSDEEYPEPVMVHEDDDNEDSVDKMISNTGLTDSASLHHGEIFSQITDARIKSPSASRQKTSSEKEDDMSRSVTNVQQLEDTMRKSLSTIQSPEISLQTEDIMNKSSSAVQPLEISLWKEDNMNKTLSTVQSLKASSPIANNMRKSVSNSVAAKSKTISTVEGKPNISKARPLMKSPHSSSSIKKGKGSSYSLVANKPQVLANKPKKMLEGSAGNRLDGVEEKLNELLDVDGGISKRKDATKGYLKLLFVTAASGDNVNGEAVQSTRDLSIILDALLKTKSRTVLVDIINKNGLQMLHNIMKQNRRNFNKTPIIRKLLKVLEFLALKEILTLEHINKSPPCPGIESFKESIIELTRHNDIQVHQIARNFRDRWIPRTARRISYSDRDDIKLELQSGAKGNWSSTPYKRWRDQGVRPTEAIDCVRQAVVGTSLPDANDLLGSSGPNLASSTTNGTKTRKRKSRWDQPAEENPDGQLPELMEDQNIKHKLDPNPHLPKIREVVCDQVTKVNEEKICIDSGCSLSRQAEIGASIDAMHHIRDDAPPGFPSLQNSPPDPSNALATTTVNLSPKSICASEEAWGCLQGRYLSHLPMSYGIPLSFVDLLGTPQEETVDSWLVAPGIPFHPFPPLPRFPRDQSNALTPSSAMTTNGNGVQQDSRCPSPHHGDYSSTPSTSGSRPPDGPPSGANNQHVVERMRCSPGGLGRNYFRQQKWNNWKCGPPWLRRRNGSGFRANNSRNGAHCVGLGNVENEIESFSCSEGASVGGDNGSSTFHQHPQRRFDH